MARSLSLFQSKNDFDRSELDLSGVIDPKAEAKAKARSSLLDFICYTMPRYEVNWHHRLFCDAIERLIFGDLDRLMILTPPRHGKCLAEGSRVLMGDGQLIPIENLHHSNTVISLSGDYNSCKSAIVGVASNGVKPVLKITLQSGKSLICTENHPLLTVDGWRLAGELSIGVSVAALRKSPIPDGKPLPYGFAALMGYLVGDGSFGTGEPRITTNQPSVVEHLREIAAANEWQLTTIAKYSYYIRNIQRGKRGGFSAKEKLRGYMKPSKSIDKRVPDCIFQANESDLCAFLAAYFNCDATVNGCREGVAEYYSVSEGLLRDVQHLLTRLGIYSTLRVKNGRYKGERHISYRLIISGSDMVLFAAKIPVIGDRGCKLRDLAKANDNKRHFPEYDSIPVGWKQHMKQTVYWHRHNSKIRADKEYTRGTARHIVLAIAAAEGKNPELMKLCSPDVIWERIVAIEPMGDRPTYDLEVAETHNFVCDGIVVHNSQVCSRHLPAYVLGRNPDAQIIATSYAADLATRMNRDVQRIIDTPIYREVFPKTTMNSKNVSADARGSYLRNSEIFEIIGHRGSYRGAGVGQGITGMGYWLGIVDDPVKNRAEAESRTVRDGIWDWYTSTFRTRAEKGAKILIVLTPWHPDDLHGRLLKQAAENPQADQWEVLRLPAIAPDRQLHALDPRQPGEALWPGKYDLAELNRIKFSIGDYDWGSLYQCNPTIEGGNIFKTAEWFDRRWFKATTYGKIVISVCSRFRDTASSSYLTIQVWAKAGDREFHLLDQMRDRLNYLDFKVAIGEIVAKWETQGQLISEMLIETRMNGSSIIDDLIQSVPVLVTPTNFKGDSDGVRGQSVAGLCQEGCVVLPSNSDAPWVDGLLSELADFPSGETVDRSNAFNQALIYLALRNVLGAVFEGFDRRVHALMGRDATDFAYDKSLPIHLSFDFNRHPATCLVAQVHDDVVIVLREFYLLNSSTFEMSETVCKWLVSLGSSDLDILVYGDASGNSRTANSDKSNWQIVWDGFKRFDLRDRCRKRYGASNPGVLDTVISVNSLFRADRLLILLPYCPELVKDLEQMRWKGDQLDKSDLMRSHEVDCLRYLVHTLFSYKRQNTTPAKAQIRIEGLPV